MRKLILSFILLIFGVWLNAQIKPADVSGKVSFIGSQNVYVRFNSTTGISEGDTLYTLSGVIKIPILIVNRLSSISCLCTPLSGAKLSVADNVIARVRVEAKNTFQADNKAKEAAAPVAVLTPSASTDAQKALPEGRKQTIRGSTSLSSYTDNSNTAGPNSQRYRYTLSLDAANIGNSKFSAESFFSFKYQSGDWNLLKSDLFSALKIYNLAVTYSPDKTMRISLGRRINPRISSIGASDGLQVEKSFNRFTLGVLAGSRPDYADYGFNLNLFQYGAFMAYSTKSTGSYSESSLAFMDQTNNSRTDRRFLYFQHSSSFLKNLSFFGSFEIDLYKMVSDTSGNEHSKNTFNLTGAYLSLSYRLGSILSVSGSYDARKNVIYYETYKTYIDRILEDEMRQGYRIQATSHISRDIILGVQAGYRFLKSDPHPAKNVYGYLTYTSIPGLKISGTVSATYLVSGFMDGNIYGLSLTRDFLTGKIQTGLGYQYVDYRLPENQLNIIQNIGNIDFSWQFSKKMFFTVYYEGTFEKQDRYNRFYLQLRKRF